MFKYVLSVILFSVLSTLWAQDNYLEIEIPMRDGKFLTGDLYLPNQTDTFPTILIMTPYGKFFYRTGLPLGIGRNIKESKYAFLIVDWRCRFASLDACSASANNGEDGYDVVEWIADQPWSSGKVGMWGPSALGGIQFNTAREQPPHLICIVPEVAAPHSSYQKYYPGGSLTTERFETLNFLFPGSFNLVTANPYYNILWQVAENTTMYPESIEVPTLLIGGWFDINIDQTIYMSDTLSTSSPVSDLHKTVIGPWVHGGTGQAFVGSEIQGELNFPEAAGKNIEYAWQFFDYYLRNIDNQWDQRSRYTYFQMGESEWNQSEIWPPNKMDTQVYYLQDHKLTTTRPEAPLNITDSYTYNPEDPSPTVGGKTLNLALDQGPYDQSNEVENRDDILLFTSDILQADFAITGKIKVKLFVSSDQPDTDFSIRLTEVFPDGRSMLLSDQIQRMRFRNGYRLGDELFMHPDSVYEINLVLEDLAITFQQGHRIRLGISSSNYPRYNRNMNTGEAMYPNAHIDTLVNPKIAVNTIHTGTTYPSQVIFPLASSTVSTPKRSESILLKIWPNPVEETLHIQKDGLITSIEIFDLLGRRVYHQPINAHSSALNLTHLKKGIYFLKEKNSLKKGIQFIKS